MSKQKLGLRKSKRGSLQDIAFAIVIMFFLGFVVLISFKIMDEWNTQIQALDIIPDKARMNGLSETWPTNKYKLLESRAL